MAAGKTSTAVSPWIRKTTYILWLLLLLHVSGGASKAVFQFTHTTAHAKHLFTFPKAIHQIAAAVPFSEVEVSLTQGRWHPQKWGVPPVPTKPTGAELHAVFPSSVPASDTRSAWVTLANGLGGLLCASLHTIAQPSFTAQLELTPYAAHAACGMTRAPSNTSAAASTSNVQQLAHASLRGAEAGQTAAAAAAAGQGGTHLHAALPQEAICTENLTPWLKLLPCRDAAGLASLLMREAVLLADYHSISMHITTSRSADGQLSHLELRQSLALVLRPIANRSAVAAAARRLPPLLPGKYTDFDLKSTFGGPIKGPCPLAQRSKVYVQVPSQQVVQLLQPAWLLQQPEHAGDPAQTQQQPAAVGSLLDSLLSLPLQLAAAAGADSNAAQGSGKSKKGWPNQLWTLTPRPHQVLVRQGQDSPEHASAWAGKHYSSSHTSEKLQQLLYVYDLHAWQQQLLLHQQQQQPAEPAAAGPPQSAIAATPVAMNLRLNWQASAAGDAQPLPAPAWVLSRRTLGAGTMMGAMVLTLQAPQYGTQHAAADGSSRAVQSGHGDDSSGAQLVCLVQVVPWMVRVWLSTLRLSINGQEVPLKQVLVQQAITPAQDRQQPLVWEVCLALPAGAQRVSLQMLFSKAFLTLQEQPPDAYRGFDVPAAVVTYRGIPAACRSNTSRSSSSSHQGLPQLLSCLVEQQVAQQAPRSSDKVWPLGSSAAVSTPGPGWVAVVGGQVTQAHEVPPLLAHLAQPSCAAQVYSPDLLVPLAVPDFSMPYNVICLTSTVLAVYVGTTLNTLLRRSSAAAAGGAAEGKQQRRRKAVRFVLVMLVFGGLGVYLDPDYRAVASSMLRNATQALTER